MNDSPQNPLETKLDEILARLKKIESQTRKSFWEAGWLKFLVGNLPKILATVLALFFAWKIWTIVGGISENVDFLKAGLTSLAEKIPSAASLKFWE